MARGQLLREFVDIKSCNVLTENREGQSPVYRIQGPFIRAELENTNSRIYPLDVLTESVKNYNENFIVPHRALGQLDHINVPSIQMDRASHLVESLTMEGNDGIGIARLLDTPMGRIAQTFAKEGILFGTSSRGIGELGGDNRVLPGYEICAIDIVHDPSAGTMVDAIVENKEWIQGSDGSWKAVEKLEQSLAKKVDPSQMSALLSQFIADIAKGGI